MRDAVDSPFVPSLFTRIRRDGIDLETTVACATALRQAAPTFSRSYFVPLPGGLGVEVMDICTPVQNVGQAEGFMVGTLSLGNPLTEAIGHDLPRTHELSFGEGDGTRLARAGLPRVVGVYVSEPVIDLAGLSLQLRLDSAAGSPRLIPNLAVGQVPGLSLAPGVVVLLLARDVRRRARAEPALAEALAFRQAMEDSLVSGLRERDLQGRITCVNPAFCKMVGFNADAMVGLTTPPYWPPELVNEYVGRQRSTEDSRAGFEPPSCAATASAFRC